MGREADRFRAAREVGHPRIAADSAALHGDESCAARWCPVATVERSSAKRTRHRFGRMPRRRTAPRTSRMRGDGRNKPQSNLSPRTPEHHGKRGSTRNQRARRFNKIENPRKPAKPPPPVQIRAAPPTPTLIGRVDLQAATESTTVDDFSPKQSISPNSRSSTASTALRCDASTTCV
jgi:hypothetical protein